MPLDLPFPLRFPGYFEAPLFRTFFHFPWDFEIAGFDCTCLMLYSFQYLINILIVFELQIPCMTFNSRSYITISTIFVTTFTGIE